MSCTVDVIIPYSPAHTPEEMLDSAIKSVESQTVPTEVIIVRDKKQRGPAWARNHGIKKAEHKYVAFLDADDLWVEYKLERQLAEMKDQDVGLCVEGKDRNLDQFINDTIRGRVMSVTPSIVIDTDKVSVTFNEDLPRYEDHLFLIEAAQEGGVCLCPDLIKVRKHESGLSATTSEKVVDNIKRILIQMNSNSSSHPYIHDFINWRLYMCGVHYRKMGAFRKSVKCQVRSIKMGVTINNLRALMTLPGYWLFDKLSFSI